MTLRTISIFGRFDVPVTRLWDALVDHEGMSRWLEMPVRVIAGPGDGGVGTVRRVGRGMTSLDEEIVGLIPPRELVYRVIRGVPLLRYYLGEVRLRSGPGGGAELWWEVTVATPIGPLTDALAGVIQERLGAAVERLRAELEGGG